MNAFSQAAVTFTSQNMGARKYQNLNRVVLNCLLCAIVTGVVLGGGAVLAGTQLLHFYSSDAAVIAAGYERLRVICSTTCCAASWIRWPAACAALATACCPWW